MKHKTLLTGLLAGWLVFSSVGFAYAQGFTLSAAEGLKPPARGSRFGAEIKGEVTAINGHALTVETVHRGAIAVHTDANTRFRAKNNPGFSLADIRVGDTIAARGRLTDDGTLSARVVLLIPAEAADNAHGKVTAISGDAITVEDKDGNATDIVTSADTRFRIKDRPDATIDDVEVGMLVGALGQFDAGGALRAKLVTAAEPRGPKGGPIEAGRVSEANGDAFVLSFPDGSALAVTTDAATVVIMRGEEGAALGLLGDVTEGAVVVVMGLPSSDGRSIAARVILLGRAPANPNGLGVQPQG
jgi:hypothetical protein